MSWARDFWQDRILDLPVARKNGYAESADSVVLFTAAQYPPGTCEQLCRMLAALFHRDALVQDQGGRPFMQKYREEHS